VKAVVKYGQRDGEVELREVPEPTAGPGEVLLEVRAAGVCGSDIEMWRHQVSFPVHTPVIQGHEFCGVIREVGPGVTEFQPGDRVASETAAYICGRCRSCRAGEYNLCPDRRGFGYGTDGAFTPPGAGAGTVLAPPAGRDSLCSRGPDGAGLRGL
jgi:L-iditol 2-dehydrogenase